MKGEGGGIYRDALEGKQARLNELRRDVQERRARVTEELLTFLPKRLGQRLDELEVASAAPAKTLDDVQRLERTLEDYRDCLDEVIEMAPDLETACRQVPDTVDELEVGSPPWSIALVIPWLKRRVSREVGRLWGKLRGILVRMDPSAELRWSLHAFQARFRVEGDPFALAAEIPNLAADPFELDFTLATSVARGAPRLSVQPGGWTSSIVESFGVARQGRVGDDRFDELFFTDATDEVAKRVLSTPVRAALLALAHFDLPLLRVRGGRAVLRWRFEPEARAIDAAVRALAGIRRTPVNLQLLAEDD